SSKITPNLEKRLSQLSKRHDEIIFKLNETLDPSELTKNSKELATLVEPKSLFEKWQQTLRELHEAQNLSSNSEDSDIRDLADEECKELTTTIELLEKNIIAELAPKDEADDTSVILEIRAGAGGDEASIFTTDLSRMYERFSQSKRWKWEVLTCSEEVGGKVQRVPATESQGRIHTSTATVAIMSQPTEVQVQIKDSDLKIDVYRASGAGGQHVNTTDSAVRITHIPTGLVVAMQDERSQHKNKQKGLKVLRAKIYDRERSQNDQNRRDSRNKQIGSGDRSEKIRTYNYPQNRVTDHRIGLTLYELDLIMSGENLVNLIEPLQDNYLAESLLEK
ncbi:hypothetical protein BY458DRAFT_448224, partial [Sporodiniella umbellata]